MAGERHRAVMRETIVRFCRRLRSDSIRRGALKLTATFKSGRADDRRSTPWSMHRGNPHDRNPGCARPPNIKQALRFLQPIGLDVGAQQGELDPRISPRSKRVGSGRRCRRSQAPSNALPRTPTGAPTRPKQPAQEKGATTSFTASAYWKFESILK